MNIFRMRWPNGRRIGIGGWLVIGPLLLAAYVLTVALRLLVLLAKGIWWVLVLLPVRALRARRI
jgi:hypothetical protein